MKLVRNFRELKLQDKVEFMGETYLVSTVKLLEPIIGLSFDKNGLCIAETVEYETMVFKYEDGHINWNDEYCFRYKNKKDAVKGHYGMLMYMQNNYKSNCTYWRAKHGRAN